MIKVVYLTDRVRVTAETKIPPIVVLNQQSQLMVRRVAKQAVIRKVPPVAVVVLAKKP